MVKQGSLIGACVASLAIAAAASAAPIVTFEASGVTTRAVTYSPGHPDYAAAPPIGTPYSVQLQFDPSVSVPTRNPMFAGSPLCNGTPAGGSFNLGGAEYSLSGTAFTNSRLPGTNCASDVSGYPPGAIEFFLTPTAVADDPFFLSQGTRFLLFSYFDSVAQNGQFPTTPSFVRPGFLLGRVNQNYEFSAPFSPRAVVDQTAPVPEPGTMTLFGLGLAAVARKFRRQRSSSI